MDSADPKACKSAKNRNSKFCAITKKKKKEKKVRWLHHMKYLKFAHCIWKVTYLNILSYFENKIWIIKKSRAVSTIFKLTALQLFSALFSRISSNCNLECLEMSFPKHLFPIFRNFVTIHIFSACKIKWSFKWEKFLIYLTLK